MPRGLAGGFGSSPRFVVSILFQAQVSNERMAARAERQRSRQVVLLAVSPLLEMDQERSARAGGTRKNRLQTAANRKPRGKSPVRGFGDTNPVFGFFWSVRRRDKRGGEQFLGKKGGGGGEGYAGHLYLATSFVRVLVFEGSLQRL